MEVQTHNDGDIIVVGICQANDEMWHKAAQECAEEWTVWHRDGDGLAGCLVHLGDRDWPFIDGWVEHRFDQRGELTGSRIDIRTDRLSDCLAYRWLEAR